MKRIVEYTTQKGEVLKLTEISSDFTNGIKIYLPLEYRTLYTTILEGMRDISIDFTEDPIFNISKNAGMEHFYIINEIHEFVDSDITHIAGLDEIIDIDKFLKIAAYSFLLDIYIENGKLANIVYCVYTKGSKRMQFVKLIDDDYPTMDYFTKGDLIK